MSSEEILTKNQLARDDLKPGTQLVVNFRQTAPDLYKFASREWIAEILEYKNYTDKKYFGNTAFSNGKMAKYLKDFHPEPDDKETAEQNAIDFPKSLQLCLHKLNFLTRKLRIRKTQTSLLRGKS